MCFSSYKWNTICSICIVDTHDVASGCNSVINEPTWAYVTFYDYSYDYCKLQYGLNENGWWS